MKKHNPNELDIIIPLSLELNHPTKDAIVKDIMHLHKNYGFVRYMLTAPSAAWRGHHYPPKEAFVERAEIFNAVKKEIEPYGIELGWWITGTLKTGPSDDFIRQVKINGESHPFSNCPSDPEYIKRFCENITLFTSIANPDFIITEDDFSIAAAQGCYCKYHLEAFEKLSGRYYSREELASVFSSDSPKDIEIAKLWRENLKNSLVNFAKEMRKAIDSVDPKIPIGYMQSGGVDFEGGGTYEIAKALAGENHTPFSRIYGTFYCGFKAKKLPEHTFHAIYSKQHIPKDFLFYHESDTFPHTRHFTSGAQMNALMGTMYSCGFDGSTFQVASLLDEQTEETAYGKMFDRERTRFNAINKLAKKCELSGVGLCYDPFYNTYDTSVKDYISLWSHCIGRFGIPYTTLESDVAFWDVRQAKYSSDEEIITALSKGLFLDGEAAKKLCERGFGKYLGVSVGKDVTEGNNLIYDLGTREVICEKFANDGNGRNMHCAHLLSIEGNGKMLELTVTDEKCEVVTEYYDGLKNYICPTMTRFENSLGGKIVVMGMTLDGNRSQALYTYRRQRLIQDLLSWCSDSFWYVKDAPDVFALLNLPKADDCADFKAMLTLVNLCEDSLDEVKIHLSNTMENVSEIYYVDINGERVPVEFEKIGNDVLIKKNVNYLLPEYLIFN